MSIRVHVAGQIVLPEAAKVSVFDRGFLFGDSVYETIASDNGRLFAFSDHLDRLFESAGRIGIVPPPRDEIARAVHETVAAAGNPAARVRIIVSRGEGWGDLDPASTKGANLVVIVGPLGGPTPEMYVNGVGIAVVSVTRNHPGAIDPAVKSGNYLNNIMALGEARRLGAHEAILCSPTGSVAEGASSNVFAVRGGVVITPALSVGILPGITRRHVLELCRRAGVQTAETDFLAPDELRTADEVFITSALRGILPATSVDNRPVREGRVGPVTSRLMERFRDLKNGSLPEQT
jgi:branched-chain amino acid aminotransferase